MRWDELRALNGQGLMRSKTWEDMAGSRWSDESGTRWAELRYKTPLGDETEAFVSYDWSDL